MTLKATDRCGQCGKQYKAKACGPTHACVYAAIKAGKIEPRDVLIPPTTPPNRGTSPP